MIDWGTLVGVTAIVGFNVAIQNLENKKVDGLTLEVRMVDSNRVTYKAVYFYDAEIVGNAAYAVTFEGVLHAGSSNNKGEIDSDWGTVHANGLWPPTVVARVKLGNET